jgi:hypothetical protein
VTAPQALRLGEDDRGAGWVMFAGVMLLVLGCTNTVEGVAAVTGSHFFVSRAHDVFGNLDEWGWVIWVIGVAQGLTGVAVLVKNQFARWLGVACAFANALAQMLMIQHYPFWSLALLSLDILVVYGLVVHGGRSYRPV